MKKMLCVLAAVAALSACKEVPVTVYTLGTTQSHPNSVVADVHAAAPAPVWFQDGEEMGPMTAVDTVLLPPTAEAAEHHFFVANPAPGAREVVVKAGRTRYVEKLEGIVDAQAHRGGMGLYPEETFAAMKNAMDLGVNTLEMDLCITADKQVVLSHDLYFHPRYSTRPDGTSVEEGDPKVWLYTLPLAEVQTWDVGLKQNPAWPEKHCMKAVKPLAAEVIAACEAYWQEKGLSPVKYNIEIKSEEGEGEGTLWPEYHEFTDLCMTMLEAFGLGDRLIVQCFDERALNYIHTAYPGHILSYLVEDWETDFDTYMAKLDFTPEWLSPNHKNVDAALMERAHERGMKVVTWTVDEPDEMRRLMEVGVEALISNYPDRLLKVTRGY